MSEPMTTEEIMKLQQELSFDESANVHKHRLIATVVALEKQLGIYRIKLNGSEGSVKIALGTKAKLCDALGDSQRKIAALEKENVKLKNRIIDLGVERVGEQVEKEWTESKLKIIDALEKELAGAKLSCGEWRKLSYRNLREVEKAHKESKRLRTVAEAARELSTMLVEHEPLDRELHPNINNAWEALTATILDLDALNRVGGEKGICIVEPCDPQPQTKHVDCGIYKCQKCGAIVSFAQGGVLPHSAGGEKTDG